MSVDATVGQTVRRHRQSGDVSLRELAARIGVSPATMSAVENGRTAVSVPRLHDIAAALGVDVRDLIGSPEAARSTPPGSASAERAAEAGDWREFSPLPIDPILAAAIRAFVSTGYHGATLRSIAELAEMSIPGVYHHYASKQDLLVRILDITMTDLNWRVERARDEGEDPLSRVALIVEALALYHACRTDLAFIGASEMRSLEPDNYRRIADSRNHVQELLDEQIAAAVDAGGLEVTHARDAGKAITTMCTGLVTWFRTDGTSPPDQIAREYAGFAKRMLGAY
ncbi:TetR family transcriptional regulator [Nocardioides sp. NPDC057577]|uniref:TetR family transcriptional regulator n=1 Tax=Nocardioides sp. NPDC057577 TaxID=3346171 RepID=UPI0036705FEF